MPFPNLPEIPPLASRRNVFAIYVFFFLNGIFPFSVILLYAISIYAISKVNGNTSTDHITKSDPPLGPQGQLPLCSLFFLVSPAKTSPKTDTQGMIKREPACQLLSGRTSKGFLFCFFNSNHLQNNSLCICASRVCESGSSYSGASDARWANRSFITLQEHSTVQHKPIFLRLHTHTYKDTRRDVYAEDSNTRKYSCVTGQQEEKHSIHVTDSSRHERVQRLAWSAPSLLSEKKTIPFCWWWPVLKSQTGAACCHHIRTREYKTPGPRPYDLETGRLALTIKQQGRWYHHGQLHLWEAPKKQCSCFAALLFIGGRGLG